MRGLTSLAFLLFRYNFPLHITHQVSSMQKNLFSTVLLWLLAILAGAQAPQQMNYQAVVRSNTGSPLSNATTVRLRFTIHDLTASGTVVFTETQFTTTNPFGLVNVQIGSVGNLAVVNWDNGAKFLQVETDVNNTGTFTDMGTSQLLSVPYAKCADVAQAVHLSNTTDSVPGSIRFNGTDFQGYSAAGGWALLGASNSYQVIEGAFADTLVNSVVFSNDSIVVAQTGDYYITLNCNGNDNYFSDPIYLDSTAPRYFTDARALVYRPSNNTFFLSATFSKPIGIPYYSTTNLGLQVSVNTVITLPAGEVLKIAHYATDPPSGLLNGPKDVYSSGYKLILVRLK